MPWKERVCFSHHSKQNTFGMLRLSFVLVPWFLGPVQRIYYPPYFTSGQWLWKREEDKRTPARYSIRGRAERREQASPASWQRELSWGVSAFNAALRVFICYVSMMDLTKWLQELNSCSVFLSQELWVWGHWELPYSSVYAQHFSHEWFRIWRSYQILNDDPSGPLPIRDGLGTTYPNVKLLLTYNENGDSSSLGQEAVHELQSKM